MKIIITTPLFEPEIAEPALYVKELANLLKDKHKLVVLTYANINAKDSNPKIISILKNQPTFIRLLKYFFKLLRILKNADIIYAQNGTATSLSSALAGIITKKPVLFRFIEDEAWERTKRLGINHLTLENFLNSTPYNFKIRLVKIIQKFVLKKAKVVLVPSKYYKKLLIEYYQIPGDKIKVIHNPHSQKIILPFESEKIPGQILADGEFLNEKDLKNLIGAILDLKKEIPNLKLKITGEIEKGKFADDESVDFVGIPTEVEKYYLLKTSEAHIVNSTIKNNPDIIFLSILAKTPNICANTESLNEIITDYESGLFTEKDNSESLKIKIKEILNNNELREKLINGASNILKEKFSWENHIKDLEIILNEQK